MLRANSRRQSVLVQQWKRKEQSRATTIITLDGILALGQG
jgi:hypothetical protein